MSRARTSLAMLALAAGGCIASERDPAVPGSRIDAPRILAVRASPPVVTLGQVTSLSALVVDASGAELAGEGVRYGWRACNPWQIVLDPVRDCTGERALELGDGATAQLDVGELAARFPPPADFLASSDPRSSARADDEPRCFAPLYELPVVLEAEVQGAPLLVLKRVRLFAGLDTPPHGHPVIEQLLLDGEPADLYTPGAAHELSVELDLESRDTVCPDGDPAEARPERVRVSLYATGGALMDNTISVSNRDDGTLRVTEGEWIAPDTLEPVVLWLIATDQTGGAAWHSVELRAGASPVPSTGRR